MQLGTITETIYQSDNLTRTCITDIRVYWKNQNISLSRFVYRQFKQKNIPLTCPEIEVYCVRDKGTLLESTFSFNCTLFNNKLIILGTVTPTQELLAYLKKILVAK